MSTTQTAQALIDSANGELRATVRTLVELTGAVPEKTLAFNGWLAQARAIGLVTEDEYNLLAIAWQVRRTEVFA